MTTQTAHIQTYDYGASLTSATLRTVDTDTVVATADSTNEVTADGGLYAAVFGEVSVIAAGDYRLRAVVGGQPINRYVTLAGVDGEVVQSRSDRYAVLDSAALRTALGMAAADLDDQLDDILTAAQSGGGGGGAGTGARTVTITVNDGTTTLQNATVRMTEGANTFTALTNASGIAVFNLDDATYTVSITKAGYSYAGTTLIVNGTETATYSITQIVATPANAPLCAVTIPVRDQHGTALVGQPVDIRFNEFVTGATAEAIVLSPPPTQTSDADGNVVVNLYRQAKYTVIYGEEEYVETIKFTTPDAGTYTVTEA